ncbi:uncharacterized protein LOC108253773 [Diaphorina citri]|uniref:Uncharacterized protein LOC108253773 n=1 Tax=Diaphorina citri TaxID=121845 RepID=A0A3Q0JF24_DIACI|nr:uncharacterized protein LOC108253773 [Diaphorina citri]
MKLEDLAHPNIYDQHFGLGYHPHDLLQHFPTPRVLSVPLRSGYVRPWRHVLENESGVSNFGLDKEGLKVSMGMYKTEKVYQLRFPKLFHSSEQLVITISFSFFQAPKKATKEGAGERSIPVVQTNQPAVKQGNKNGGKAASGEKMES